MSTTLTIACAKGRIFEETIPLLAAAGIVPAEDPEVSRKLILPTNQPDVRLLILRASDVPTFVENGAADVGISGKDTLLEYGSNGLYEPLDLEIAKCKLMVAGKDHSQLDRPRLRVASKYADISRRYFAAKGQQVDVIKLYGGMELAPLVGLADVIVDVVDTGNTLKANGLIPLEHIADISSRLVVNKASMKMKHERIRKLIDDFSSAI